MTVKFEYDRARAMKQKDFKPCIRCGKGVMHSGVPLFRRITIEAMGLDVAAAQRHHGLEMMLGGNAAIAHAMGQDADLGIPIGDAERGLLCNDCCCDPNFSFGEAMSLLAQKSEAA